MDAWNAARIHWRNPTGEAVRRGTGTCLIKGMRIVALIRRLRDEFTAMPGLRLTVPQVERLCATDPSTSGSALHALVTAGFLSRLPDGSYARTDLVASTPADPVVAGRARMRSPDRLSE
jgi:hypothetical protein